MTFVLALLLSIVVRDDVPRMSATELRAKMASGEAIAIDVRGSVPYELGHLPGAVWMPLGMIEARAGELPEDKLLVTYCTCKAEESSLEAALLLAKGGFERVAVLHGGYPAWVAADFPTESRRDGGIAAPAAVSCSSELRKVEGVVKNYSRAKDKTLLTIGEERIEIARDDPSRFYLIHGSPFASNDWNRVEAKKGELREGMRAIAWICAGGSTMIDWQP